MSESVCRWGILSAANIAMKNWQSIGEAGNAQLVAVASRSEQKAQKFIEDCQSSFALTEKVEAVGDYQSLLNRDDIDAVYLPLPTGVRSEWAIKAAEHGKHVLAEKPCGTNVADLQKVLDACQQNNVQFMDGVMFMHGKRLQEMTSVLRGSGRLGSLRRITSAFSFCGDDEFVADNIRTASSLEPAGCVGDLGWYTIRITLWAMNYELPVEVTGRTLSSVDREDGGKVPTEFEATMTFANGVTASFYCSFQTVNQQWFHVSGSQGALRCDDFVIPVYGSNSDFEVHQDELQQSACRWDMHARRQKHSVSEYSNNGPDSQETRLFQRFSELVLSGQPDPIWPQITLKTQQVMDAALQSAQNNSVPVSI